jgi:hypothetical protein
LEALHAEGKSEERETAPAENLLTQVLKLTRNEGFSVLVLVDEVLMYAREKAGASPVWRSRLANFFQYLTQAVSKVDGCALVASLLASDPRRNGQLADAADCDTWISPEAIISPTLRCGGMTVYVASKPSCSRNPPAIALSIGL